MKTALGVVAGPLSLFAMTLIACSGGGAGSIDCLDAGGGQRQPRWRRRREREWMSRDASSERRVVRAPREHGVQLRLCERRTWLRASVKSGRWTVQLSEQACPPTEPFACGKTTCTAAQYCVTPCCGGPAPACNPIPDAVCPAGTTPSTCNGGLPGCVDGPRTPPAPYCVDSPSPPPSGCTLEAGKRSFRRSPAPSNAAPRRQRPHRPNATPPVYPVSFFFFFFLPDSWGAAAARPPRARHRSRTRASPALRCRRR